MMSARQETTKDIPSVLVPGSETYEGVFKTEDGPRRVGFSIFRRPRGPDEPISEFPVSLEGSGFAGEIFTHEGVSHVRSDISHDHTFWTKDERIDCKWDVEEAEENEVDPNPDVFKRFDVAAELGGPVSCASRTILAPVKPFVLPIDDVSLISRSLQPANLAVPTPKVKGSPTPVP
jgi:hypothetical protein